MEPKSLAALLAALNQPSGQQGGLYGHQPQGMLSQPPPQEGILAQFLRPAPPIGARPAPNGVLEEMQFRSWIQQLPWYSQFKQRHGEAPDISPNANYDYRAAWKGGISPQPDPYDQNAYHWPSSLPSGQMLKAPDHPTAWKEHFMRETGQNPDALGLKSPIEGEAWKRRR